MTDLPKRLEAAGRREANNALNEQIYERGGIPPDDEIAPPENYRYHNGFTDCHRSLNPLILKMAEALEKISVSSEGFYTEEKVMSEGHTEMEILDVDKIARDALADLEKYLEGKK